MSEANKRGLPLEDICIKQTEIIESLSSLNHKIISILGQYTVVEEYEHKLNSILQGNDEII